MRSPIPSSVSGGRDRSPKCWGVLHGSTLPALLAWTGLLLTGFLLTGLLTLTGCKDAKIELPSLDKAAEKAKEAVTNTVESAKQAADVAGKFELDVKGPVAASGCYARFLAFTSKRPSVLQVTSYNDPANESFPSILIQAQVDDATPAALAGKTVKAQVYVQTAAAGPVWHSPADRPVDVQIQLTGDSQIEGNIVQGALVNADSGEESPLQGKFTGSIK